MTIKTLPRGRLILYAAAEITIRTLPHNNFIINSYKEGI